MKLPGAEPLARLLRDLLGRPVTFVPASALSAAHVARIAVYADSEGHVLTLGLADLPFAAFAGAALAMIPKNVAGESLHKKALESNLHENFYEVVNIVSSAINSTSGMHVHLVALVDPKSLPPAAAKKLAATSVRLDFEVKIGDYGSGHFSLLA